VAYTVNNVNEELIKFRREVTWTFLRGSRFDAYTGGIGSVIQRVMDLAADGKQVNVPLMDQLKNAGVATGALVGNEEALDNYGMPLWADWGRHAVVFQKSSLKEAAFNIREQATPALNGWTARNRLNDMVDALLSIPTAAIPPNFHADPGNRVNGLRWSAASAANQNAWQAANIDRIVTGAKVSNTISGNVSGSLLLLAAATDLMSCKIGRLAKRMAQQTTNVSNWPAIKPWMLRNTDEEWYVCFIGTRSYRDLSGDNEMAVANEYARWRDRGDPTRDNPIFAGSHLIKDGIIYREIPEIDSRYILGTGTVQAPNGPLAGKGAGAPAVDVAPFFLCGQNAYAYVVGQLPKATSRDETDYQFLRGMGIEMQYGYGKIAKAPVGGPGAIGTLKDFGVVTGFVAAPADA
jgi:Protein of unknown function (DUF4043)